MLAIIAILMGVAVVSFDSVSLESTMRQPVNEFQRMTQEAMRRASLYDMPQVIRFDHKSFALHYRQRSQSEQPTPTHGFSTEHTTLLPKRTVEMMQGMRVSLRRFGSDKFLPAAGQRLMISPGGICEPLTIRFEYQLSWVEATLDPLSGMISDEAMHLE